MIHNMMILDKNTLVILNLYKLKKKVLYKCCIIINIIEQGGKS